MDLVAYRNVVVGDRPRAYWPMDTVSGTSAIDWSGHAHTGTFSGTGGSLAAKTVTGALGKGVELGSTFHLPWPATARQTASSWSRECWLYSNSTAFAQQLVSQYTAANGEDFWEIRTDGRFWVFAFISGGFQYNSDGAALLGGRIVNSNRPYHLVLTRSSGGFTRVYMNGGIVLEVSAGTGSLISNNGPAVGRRIPDNSANFNGLLCHAAIYDYALSPAQVLKHYEIGSGMFSGRPSSRSAARGRR